MERASYLLNIGSVVSKNTARLNIPLFDLSGLFYALNELIEIIIFHVTTPLPICSVFSVVNVLNLPELFLHTQKPGILLQVCPNNK